MYKIRGKLKICLNCKKLEYHFGKSQKCKKCNNIK